VAERRREGIGGRTGLTWALLALAGCAGGGAPILDAPRTLGGQTLLLAPEVRVATPGSQIADSDVAQLLQYELRTALGGAGVTVSDRSADKELEPLRSALLTAWQRQRGKGSGRYRAGTELPLGAAAGDPALRGVQSAILPVLTRDGVSPREDGFVPLPPDHLPTLPESRPDYVVPQTGGAAGALTLDLLVVDLASQRVVAQRRASYAATSTEDVAASLPVLAREASRGLTSGGASAMPGKETR
jgi:hypothetical protein